MKKHHDKKSSAAAPPRRNIGTVDRILSGIVGGAMIGLGIWQATRNPWRLVLAALGPPLVARAALGRSALYRALGVSTAKRKHTRHSEASE